MQTRLRYALYIVFNERETVGRFVFAFPIVSVYIIPPAARYVNINLLKVFEFTNC